MRSFTIVVCICAMLPAFAQNAKPARQDSLTIKVDAIFSAFNKTSPGAAVGIVQNGKVIFRKGYGMANLEYDIPITPTVIFDIASVSKQFAGLAISTLVQQGRIALTDPIHKYIPELPDFGHTITINHLLHHTSGLRDWPEGLNVAGWRWNEDFSFADIVRMIANQKELDFVPGSRYSYSNTGFNLLAILVERVTQKSFRDWTNENIFVPLKMTSTHFHDEESEIVKNMVYSYRKDGDVYRKQMTGLTAPGSSSLFTNVDDLCKWAIHFDGRIAAKDPVYMRMLDTIPLNSGEPNVYAFGLALGEMGGINTISHTGGWAGYRTLLLKFPDEKLSIILLANRSDFNIWGYAGDVAKAVLGSKLKSTGATIAADKIKDQPAVKLNVDIARKQEGTYKLGEGWYVTLKLDDGVLTTQANGEPKFSTTPKSDSTLWVEAYNASMTFVTSKDGSINSLKYKGIVAPRITPVIADLSKLAQYAGSYYSEEFQTIYKVEYTGDRLVMRHMRLGELPLDPDVVFAGVFNSPIGRLEFNTDNGKVLGFMLSRGRVKNLRFVRVELK